MKREAGFSLIELLVAVAVLVVILAGTMGALNQGLQATEGVTLMADTQENLRAGLNYMVRDLVQAGESIPQGGIPLPNTAGGVVNINEPSPQLRRGRRWVCRRPRPIPTIRGIL